MQSGIALTLFLLLKLCDALVYRTCLFLYGVFWPCWFCWPFGLKKIKKTAQKAQASLHRYQPAIKSAAVEFHKAQCFFMLAIGSAGQIVLRQRSLEDGSLQSLMNYCLVGLISLNGILSITLTLLCLHTVGMHSWYLLLLSICTVVLSTVTLSMSGRFALSLQDLSKIRDSTNSKYPMCGNKDPSIFCLDENYNINPSNRVLGSDYGAVIFSLVILGLLTLDYGRLQELLIVQRFLKRCFGKIESLLKLKSRKDSNHSQSQKTRRDNTADYVNGLSNFLYLFIWAWYGFGFAIFLVNLSDFKPVNGWAFGQIVAITVWAGPILEFVKLLVRKCNAFTMQTHKTDISTQRG